MAETETNPEESKKSKLADIIAKIFKNKTTRPEKKVKITLYGQEFIFNSRADANLFQNEVLHKPEDIKKGIGPTGMISVPIISREKLLQMSAYYDSEFFQKIYACQDVILDRVENLISDRNDVSKVLRELANDCSKSVAGAITEAKSILFEAEKRTRAAAITKSKQEKAEYDAQIKILQEKRANYSSEIQVGNEYIGHITEDVKKLEDLLNGDATDEAKKQVGDLETSIKNNIDLCEVLIGKIDGIYGEDPAVLDTDYEELKRSFYSLSSEFSVLETKLGKFSTAGPERDTYLKPTEKDFEGSEFDASHVREAEEQAEQTRKDYGDELGRKKPTKGEEESAAERGSE